jgi:hypothetical protein
MHHHITIWLTACHAEEGKKTVRGFFWRALKLAVIKEFRPIRCGAEKDSLATSRLISTRQGHLFIYCPTPEKLEAFYGKLDISTDVSYCVVIGDRDDFLRESLFGGGQVHVRQDHLATECRRQ